MYPVSYNVKVKIENAIYTEYMDWLKAHITGDTTAGIKGMLEVWHEEKPIFPFVALFSCGPVEGAYLVNIRYFAEDLDSIHTYIEHYAAEMRGDIPASFMEHTTFNRSIQSGKEETPVGVINKEMEVLYTKHAADFELTATFGITMGED